MTKLIEKRLALALAVCASVAAAVMLPAAAAGFEPSKFVLSSDWGWEVETTGGSVCTVASGDKCQAGQASSEPGGFLYPESVAVAPDGNVYVAEKHNNRIQEFTPGGAFVLMFGWEVNQTKVEAVKAKGGTPSQSEVEEEDVCTEQEIKTSGVKCKAGVEGTGLPGQLREAQDVAVDPSSHDVYVLDYAYHRVDEFTENGRFVLMIGGEVNQTKAEAVKAKGGTPTQHEVEEENLCTQQEIESSSVKCQAGIESGAGSTVRGAFKPTEFAGNLLAVGPEDHLYVGDEGRVQQFEASGKWLGEVSTAAPVSALALNGSGEVFVAEQGVAGVHDYKGDVAQACVIDPSSHDIGALAFDAYGRLGLLEGEGDGPHGALYRASGSECGEKVSEFGPFTGEFVSLAFDVYEPSNALADRAYLPQLTSDGSIQQIAVYAPVVFPEVRPCAASEVTSTSATLCGEVNPNDLLANVFFAYGTTPGELLKHTAPPIELSGEAFQPVSWDLTGLVANQVYWYQVVAEAAVGGKSEEIGGRELSFRTTTPAPQVPGAPSAASATDRTAQLTGLVNDEHAPTQIHFEYKPCEKLADCAAGGTTEDEELAALNGLVGVTQEAHGLTPSTLYSVQLIANNAFEFAGKPEGGEAKSETEGHFVTKAPPVPHAATGPALAVGATTATITGSIDPEGVPAVYRFEFGIYNGTATNYAVAVSESTGAGNTPIGEGMQLSGLLPGTTYAYRIAVESGYGGQVGETQQFTTAGLPSALVAPTSPAQLPIPAIKFPKEGAPRAKELTRAQKLAKALKECAKKPKAKRAACKRSANKRYGPTGKKKVTRRRKGASPKKH